MAVNYVRGIFYLILIYVSFEISRKISEMLIR